MKKKLLSLVAMLLFAIYFGQANFWTPSKNVVASNIKANKKSIINPNLYSLDINALKEITANSPKKTKSAVKSNVIVSFPDGDGNSHRWTGRYLAPHGRFQWRGSRTAARQRGRRYK